MTTVAQTMPAAKTSGLTATPLLRLQRARDLYALHTAVCRYCRAEMACGTEGDLGERVKRLEASRG